MSNKLEFRFDSRGRAYRIDEDIAKPARRTYKFHSPKKTYTHKRSSGSRKKDNNSLGWLYAGIATATVATLLYTGIFSKNHEDISHAENNHTQNTVVVPETRRYHDSAQVTENHRDTNHNIPRQNISHQNTEHKSLEHKIEEDESFTSNLAETVSKITNTVKDLVTNNPYEKLGITDETLIREADKIYNQILDPKPLIGTRKVTKTVKDQVTHKKKKVTKMEDYAIRMGWAKEKVAYEHKFSIMSQFNDLIIHSSTATDQDTNLVNAHATQEAKGDIFAVSSAGAVGFWQFIDETARAYGATVNDFQDQRRNPIKSNDKYITMTRADNERFNKKREYILAAYNTGPGNVFKAIAKAAEQDGKDLYDILNIHNRNRRLTGSQYEKAGVKLFRQEGYSPTWEEIAPFLRKETREYVPEILAKFKILENRDKLGLKIHQMELYTDKFKNLELYTIKKGDHLWQVAREHNIDPEKLIAINPELVDKDKFVIGGQINISSNYSQ